MSFIRLAPTAPGHKTLFRPVKQKLFRIFLIFKKFHNFFCCTIKSEQTWLDILTKVNNVETNQSKSKEIKSLLFQKIPWNFQ